MRKGIDCCLDSHAAAKTMLANNFAKVFALSLYI